MTRSIIFFIVSIITLVQTAYATEQSGIAPITLAHPWEEAYRYLTVGAGPVILIPAAGIGYRSRTGHNGLDASLTFSSIYYANMLQGSLTYLRYGDLSNPSPWYGGAGLAVSYLFGCAYGVAPDLVLGKELLQSNGSKHFIEMRLQPCTLAAEQTKKRLQRVNVPALYLRYGFAF